MKRLSAVFLVLGALLLASSAEAQVVDHWATRVDCESATGAAWYEPAIVSNKPLGKDEVMLPHPTGACMEIDLPDRLTKGYPVYGRGWVRIPPQRNVVYEKVTLDGATRLVVKRLAQCDNVIYAEVPLKSASTSSDPLEHREKVEVSAREPGPATLGRQADELARREARQSEAPQYPPASSPQKRFWETKTGKWMVGGGIAAVALGAVFGGSKNENVNTNCNGATCR